MTDGGDNGTRDEGGGSVPDATGVDAQRERTRSTVRSLGLPIAADAEEQALLRAVTDHYHQRLKETPTAVAYLEKRGLTGSEFIDRFRVGYSDRTLGLLLPEKNRKVGKALRQRLTDLGILKPTGHETFRGALVIPITDEHGRTVTLYGRLFGQGLRPNVSQRIWLNGNRRGVLNVEALQATRMVVVTDSPMNLLSAWCHGVRNVIAVNGTDAPTDELLDAFQQHGTEQVVIAFRHTEDGDRAAGELTTKLLRAGLTVYKAAVPLDYDLNDVVRQATDPEEALARVIREAVWLGGKPRKTGTPSTPASSTPSPSSPSSAPTAPSQGSQAAPRFTLPTTIAALEANGEDEVVLRLGDRAFRVRGLTRCLGSGSLRLNVLVTVEGSSAFWQDTFDLYSAKHRLAFATNAAQELGVKDDILKKDVGQLLLKLEQFVDERQRESMKPPPTAPKMTPEESAAALDYLKAPELLDRIAADIEKCGLVGEKTNALLAYLGAISRKLDRPLALLVRSSSGSGKSALMETVMSLVPEEDKLTFSSLTSQALYYIGSSNLEHRALAVAEDQGTARASYPLKLLLSEGSISIASTTKDESGRMVSETYRAQGPVALMLTSTSAQLDEELLNRTLVLTIDESKEQTQAVHQLQRQRETLEGLLADKEREHIVQLHQNAQRLLRPLKVVNPFAPELTFSDAQPRMRRQFPMYLSLIQSIALLRQYARTVKNAESNGVVTEYIEVEPDDIEVANALIREVLGQSLDDLPPQSRRLLVLIDKWVTESCTAKGIERADFRFTRRDLRRVIGWSDTALKVHLKRLADFELLVIRGGIGRLHEYAVTFEGITDSEPVIPLLLDPKALKSIPTTKGGQGFETGGQGAVSPRSAQRSGGGQGAEIGEKPNGAEGIQGACAIFCENEQAQPGSESS